MHGCKVVDVVILPRRNSLVIVIYSMTHIFCAVVSLEALDDALVHGLDIQSEIWLEVINLDVPDIIWDNVTSKIILN